MVYASVGAAQSEIIPNQHLLDLVEALHKPIARKLEKQKVYSSFKNNISGADLADVWLISKFKKVFPFSLCATGIYSKYAWVTASKIFVLLLTLITFKDKKVLPLLMLF